MVLEGLALAATSLGTCNGRGFDFSGVYSNNLQFRVHQREWVDYRLRSGYYDTFYSQRTVDGNMSDTYVSLKKIESILNKISQLRENWDGYGAMPISVMAINNIRAIGKAMFNWDFSKWQITPSVNGDIYINYKGKDKMAGFLIGDELFTYFLEEKGQLSGQENCSFDARVVVGLMRDIAN